MLLLLLLCIGSSTLRLHHRQVYRAIKFYYIVESRTVWPNLWRVVNLIHILLILAHWFGCFYFLLSEVEGFQVSICAIDEARDRPLSGTL